MTDKQMSHRKALEAINKSLKYDRLGGVEVMIISYDKYKCIMESIKG